MKKQQDSTNGRGGKRKAEVVATQAAKRRRYVPQTDVPKHAMEDALRVARAISDNYGKQPTAPVDVAAAMGMAPTSGPFRSLAGASLAYGFTEGGPNASEIAMTSLGRRAVAPTEEGDDFRARREAIMRPRVMREFLDKYNGSRLPKPEIASNVLEQMGVDGPATDETFALIVKSADDVGFLRDINGINYVSLDGKSTDSAAGEDSGAMRAESLDDSPDISDISDGEEGGEGAISTESTK